MKTFSRVLCVTLSVIMLLSAIQLVAGAVTYIGEVHAQVTQPTEDDIYAYEYYNKNNIKKFEPFVTPEYKGAE